MAMLWGTLLAVLTTTVLAMDPNLQPPGPATGSKDDRDPRSLESTVAQLYQRVLALEKAREETPGSVFVRWGRERCPADTNTIYSGVAGGSYYEQGGAANRLCLSLDPVFDDIAVDDPFPSSVFGAEYRLIADLEDYDVACSVCRTPHATTFMLPGTNVCPDGWKTQYWGHVTGNHDGHPSAEFLCLDRHPQGKEPRDDNGALFRYTHAACGSLPCPPYTNNSIVTCAVCSQ